MHDPDASPLALAAIALASATPAPAQSNPGMTSRGQPVHIMKDSAADRVVRVDYQRELSFVRIEQREPGAALNQHPFSVSADALRALLAQVQLPGEKEALWNAQELDEMAPPLASAEQAVSFSTAGQQGLLGPLAPKLTTTARIFRRDGQLQLIVGLVRQDIGSAFRGSGVLGTIEVGQRAAPVESGTQLGIAPEFGRLQRVTGWCCGWMPPPPPPCRRCRPPRPMPMPSPAAWASG